MPTVSWRIVNHSDADRCDECDRSFAPNKPRLLGEDENRNQLIIHQNCKQRWLSRTGYSENPPTV
jgi:hypothetical protein